MTTNSTKCFCNRGALSARFILVDTPLRGEYYYDGEHGKYYFGARYFDPFFGMWLSPDPAAVFFREVYAPLKWRDFIEKDILQRLNGEAVLLKQSFRASAQFANPYSYGGDPLNYVDPNGEAVHILVGAIIGAVVGTVNGVIQCTSAGGGSCTKSIGVGFVGGAAVGAAAAATGGLATGIAGVGFQSAAAGAVVGGAAGGAVGGAGNYVNQSIVNGGFNSGDLWESTWKGAAAGAVGGGAGAFAGDYMAQGYASMVGGFAGGASGSAFNGGEGWDVLKGGLMGSGMALASYAMVWGYNNHIRSGDLSNKDNVKFAEKNDKSVPTKKAGSFKGDDFEKLAAEDFKKWHASAEWKNGEGESAVAYRKKTSFWTGEKSVIRVPKSEKHIEGTIIKLNAIADYIFHSRPNHAYPSIADYSSAQYSYNTYGGQSYLLAPNNTDVYWISPAKQQFLKMEY